MERFVNVENNVTTHIIKSFTLSDGENNNIGIENMGDDWEGLALDIEKAWKVIVVVETVERDYDMSNLEILLTQASSEGSLHAGPFRLIRGQNLEEYKVNNLSNGAFYEVPALGSKMAIRIRNNSGESVQIRSVIFKLL